MALGSVVILVLAALGALVWLWQVRRVNRMSDAERKRLAKRLTKDGYGGS
ncbi:MAG: hypothetical protein QOD39_3217 [Mycobacterium sp.]|nr:hypothetical protein [Mycobacterium sp.]